MIQSMLWMAALAAGLGLTIPQARAQGDHGGNGGGVHVCYDGKKVDADGNRIIKSVEMYDLYEGRARYFFKEQISPALVTEQDILKFAYWSTQAHGADGLYLNGLRALAARLEAAVRLVNEKIRPTDEVLDLVPDANRLMHGENCEYDQLANWDDRTGNLLVKRKYLEMIEKQPLDLAAFKTHEAFYFLDRKYNGAKNSDDARESNAMVYQTVGGALKVSVKHAVQKGKVTLLRPQWTSAACYTYSVNASDRMPWRMSLEPMDKKTTVLSGRLTGVFEDRVQPEFWYLHRTNAAYRFWGNAYGLFHLFPEIPGDPMNIKIKVRSDACGETDESVLSQKGGFVFSIDP